MNIHRLSGLDRKSFGKTFTINMASESLTAWIEKPKEPHMVPEPQFTRAKGIRDPPVVRKEKNKSVKSRQRSSGPRHFESKRCVLFWRAGWLRVVGGVLGEAGPARQTVRRSRAPLSAGRMPDDLCPLTPGMPLPPVTIHSRGRHSPLHARTHARTDLPSSLHSGPLPL